MVEVLYVGSDFASLKAIVSSGYFEDPVMSNYEEYGFRGITFKPYKAEELSRTLENVFKEKR